MAVQEITVLFSGQTGTRANDERTYQVVWMVRVDDPLDEQVVVLNALTHWLGMPYYGLGLNGSDPEALCVRLNADRVPETRLMWLVTGAFEVPTLDVPAQQDPEGNPTDNPEQWRPQLDISAVKFMVPCERAKIITDLSNVGRPGDSEGPMINAAGEVLDPAYEREDAHKIYRLTVFRQNYDANLYDSYTNAINNDVFVLTAPGFNRAFSRWELKMEPIVGSLNWHIPTTTQGPAFPYWKITFEMHHNPDSWFVDILNAGNMRRAQPGDPDGKGGTLSHSAPNGQAQMRRIVDDDDMPIRCLLNRDGQPLEPGQEPDYLTYSIYLNEKAYSALGI